MTTTRETERHALMHINTAKLRMELGNECIQDYACAAMEAQGYDPDLAADAVAKVWRELQQ